MPRSPRTKTSVAVRLRSELANEMRVFIKDNAGKPLYLTLSSFAEEAVERHLAFLNAQLEGRSATSRLPASPANHSR